MHHNIQSTPFVLAVLLMSACGLLSPATGHTGSIQADEWQITADKITRYENPASVIAEGNVVLEKIETVTRQKKRAQKTNWSDLLGEKTKEDRDTASTEPETVTEQKTLTTIKADWIAYDVDLGKIKARGNLLINIGPDELTADKGAVDLNQETGTFYNATIIREYKDMHLEGRVIEKTGEITYHIKDGRHKPCK
ncbi:MAG: hypothetical protein L3J49_07580, partial [Desulfobulbaceae bacterium]|nr:hypothetical protein [Desulfobulbaceae bacterium]